MPQPYTPREGSLAQRLIAHLQTQPAGTQLSNNEIASLLGCANNCVFSSLKTATRHGCLVKINVGGFNTAYSLPEGTHPDDTAIATASPSPRKKRGSGAAPAEPAAQQSEPAIGFNVARWADGDVTLHNVTVSEDGNVLLTPGQVQTFLNVLEAHFSFKH